MAQRDSHLHEVLDGYAKFLQDKNLALDKHQPYLVRWVREFLLFARAHAGYSFEQTLDPFSGRSGRACGHEAVAASAGVGRDTHLPLSPSTSAAYVAGPLFEASAPACATCSGGPSPSSQNGNSGRTLRLRE